MKKILRVGFVGNCILKESKTDKVKKLVKNQFDIIEEKYNNFDKFILVSGATNMGSLKIAYDEALKRGWEIEGIACELEREYEMYPKLKDENVVLVGKKWGDESYFFEELIDVLVRVGGGKQAFKETKDLKEKHIDVYEYNI